MIGPTWFQATILLLGVSCVSSNALPGTSAPNDIAGPRHAEQAMPVETPVDVQPYVGRRFIARVKQGSYEGTGPSFDFVVFDDGAVFFEGESCVADVGLRKAMLTEVELRGLQALAEPTCGRLLKPPGQPRQMVMCIHGDHALVSCDIGGHVRLAIDCEGSDLFQFASDLVEAATIRKWIGTPALQESSCRSGKRYVARQIDRMLLGPARAH